MDLRQLEAFAAVISIGSVTGAAKVLDRSQPTVTRLIRDLETSLGLPLFERNGPKVIPTRHAFTLAAQIEGVIGGVRQIQRSAEHLVRAEELELRVTATPSLAAGLVPLALARLIEGRERLDIQLRSQTAEQGVDSVLSKSADVGVVSLPLEHKGLDVHWIGEAPCVAVVASDSPLAAMPRLTLAAISTQTVITLSDPYRLRRRIDRALDLGPNVHVLETNSSLNAAQMARAGLGVALIDPVTALGMPFTGATAIPIEPDIPFFFGVMTAFGEAPTKLARQLIDGLEEAAGKLLPGFVRHEVSAHDALLRRIHDR